MNRKVVLMESVSTVALAAVATAQAADLSAGVVEAPAVPQGFTVSIEGGALFGVNTLAEDKLGPIDSAISASGGTTELNIEDILGYRGAISLGKQLDPNWDVKAAIAAYTTGKVPFLSLIEAQRNLIGLRDRYYETTGDCFRRRATLERVFGGPLTPTHDHPHVLPAPQRLPPPDGQPLKQPGR